MQTVPELDCAALFDAEGVEMVVGGNLPVLLDDPDSVWYVKSGRLEVFSVPVLDGKAAGSRHHFYTAVEGDALFGVDLERFGEGQGFLAVGVVGTRLLRLNRARLLQHLSLPGFAAFIGGLVDRWVTGLSAGIARTIVPRPRADVQAEPGETGEIGDGKRLRARKGVVWVRHLEGASIFIGMEELSDLPEGAPFPVSADSWLQALGVVKFDAVDTASAITSGGAWPGLDAFYGALFRCEFFNVRLAAADELNRLREKSELDRRVRESSLAALADVMARRPSAFGEVPAGDALLAACTLVGRAMGIEIKAPPKAKEGEVRENPFDEILRASRVRSRLVMLKGDWWKEEAWPMLGFLTEGMRPVAIMRVRRGFEIHDPVDHSRTRVTRDVAARMEPRAHSLYRPLPDKALSPLDLFKFGLMGQSFDLARPLIVGLGAGLLSVFPPYFVGLLVDTVIPEAARNQLVQIAIILAIVSFTSATFEIVRNLSILRLETKMSSTVQPALWDRLLGLPIPFFRRFSAGDLSQRVNSIDAMRSILSGATLSTVMTSLFSVFLLAQMFYYSWPLALLGTVLVAVSMCATGLAAYLKLRQHRDVMAIEGKITGLVLQLLTGISKIRVTGAEGRAFAQWAREFAKKKKIAVRTGKIEYSLATFNAVFPVVAMMLVFYLLLGQISAGSGMSAGHFIAFNAAFGTFMMQMLQFSGAAMSVLLIVPLYERAKPVLETLPEVDTTKADPGELSGRIDIDRVSFRYVVDGPLILNDVSLHIAPGEYVAVVGPSGSGKSTLFRMLLGLDVAESGSIYFDGKNLAQLDVAKVRRRMGVVMQNGKIRAGSIFDNIVGSAPLTMEDAWEAARMSGFEEDVRQMPMGMQTMLQQGGMTLSGGQRQRLMIARAIVNKPRILLFDEATSALDNRTQAIVSRSLHELQATRVAIAHRLSTIQGADRICVLAGGVVVQLGSYEELASVPGMFADLIKRQIA